jgi:hypothetical protein
MKEFFKRELQADSKQEKDNTDMPNSINERLVSNDTQPEWPDQHTDYQKRNDTGEPELIADVQEYNGEQDYNNSCGHQIHT